MKSVGKVAYIEDSEEMYETFRNVWKIEAIPPVAIWLKRMFPRANKARAGFIFVKNTPEICREIELAMLRFDFKIKKADAKRLKEGADDHRATQQLVEGLLANPKKFMKGKFLKPDREPREYQNVAADLVLKTGRLLLGDDVGLGKSMSALMVLKDPKAHPAVVVCPTHLTMQWREEVEETFPELRTFIPKTTRIVEPADTNQTDGHPADIIILNYAKLEAWSEYLEGWASTVIFDEVQELRRTESQKYAAAGRIADKAKFKVGLSATPVYNYGGEMHNIFNILAPEALGDRKEFAREWCEGYWGPKVTVHDPKAMGEHLRREGLFLRRTRADVGRELPEVVKVTYAIESDDDVYEDLTGDALSLAELILDNAADGKDRWTASGELDWKLRQATGVAKAAFTADFVKLLLESEEQVVLFGWHHAVYDIWKERLADYGPVLYTGKESTNQKQLAKQAFLGGSSRVLIMSLRSGLGLDGLQDVSKVCVFGELDWSPGMHDQCVGRVHRDGQEEGVTAYFLVSNNGSDPLMADVLDLKRMQSKPMVDPDAELFEGDSQGDRIRKLAEDLVKQRTLVPA